MEFGGIIQYVLILGSLALYLFEEFKDLFTK